MIKYLIVIIDIYGIHQQEMGFANNGKEGG